MDNLALSVSKSITDYLEQNEKKLANHSIQLETQNHSLSDLQTKFDRKCEEIDQNEKKLTNQTALQNQSLEDLKTIFERKCEELEKENSTLKSEILALKKNEESSAKRMIIMQSDIEKMQNQAKKYSEWVDLLQELTQQVHDLNGIRDATKMQITTLYQNQTKLDKKIDRQQKMIATASAAAKAASASVAAAATTPSPFTNAPRYNVINRTPVRSPSTSSFFNGNNNGHSSIHRFKPQDSNNTHNHYSHFSNDDFLNSLDAPDDLSELSENAVELVKNVEALQELQRSFEKNSSICSD